MSLDKNVDLYIQPDGKLTMDGLVLLYYYYYICKEKYSCYRGQFFIGSSVEDLDNILLTYPEDKPVVFLRKSNVHITPVIRKGKRFYILDSLGRPDKRGSTDKTGAMWYVKEIAEGLVKDESQVFLHPLYTRQSDEVSCGTDAMMTIKEAFKVGDALFSFIDSQRFDSDSFLKRGLFVKSFIFPFLPAELAKFTQPISFLEGKGYYSVQPTERNRKLAKHGGGSETIEDYANRHKGRTFLYDAKGQPVPDNNSQHRTSLHNQAVERRRNKYRNVVFPGLLNQLTQSQFDDIKREAFGLTRVFSVPTVFVAYTQEQLERLFEAEGVNYDGNSRLYYTQHNRAEEYRSRLHVLQQEFHDKERKFLLSDASIRLSHLRDLKAKILFLSFIIEQGVGKFYGLDSRNKVETTGLFVSPAPPVLEGIHFPDMGQYQGVSSSTSKENTSGVFIKHSPVKLQKTPGEDDPQRTGNQTKRKRVQGSNDSGGATAPELSMKRSPDVVLKSSSPQKVAKQQAGTSPHKLREVQESEQTEPDDTIQMGNLGEVSPVSHGSSSVRRILPYRGRLLNFDEEPPMLKESAVVGFFTAGLAEQQQQQQGNNSQGLPYKQ